MTNAKKWLLFLGLLVFCGGVIIAADRVTKNIGDVSCIILKGNNILHIMQGKTNSLQIEADKTVIQNILVKEDGKDLCLGIKEDEDDDGGGFWDVFTFSRPEFYLTVKNLEKVESCGSNRIVLETPIEAEKIELIISGSGDMLIDEIVADDIRYSIHGSGKFRCNTTKSKNSFLAEISGSGDVKINSLFAKQAEAEISGSGNIKISDIKAEKTNSKISGSGYINLYGVSNNQDVCVSGSGDYIAKNLQSDFTDIVASGSANIKVKVSKSIDITTTRFKHGHITVYGNPKKRNIKDKSNNITFCE